MGDSDSSLGWTTLNISDSILKSHGHFIFSYEMIAYDRFKFCRFRFNSADLLFFFPILLILFPSQESQLLARVKGFFFFLIIGNKKSICLLALSSGCKFLFQLSKVTSLFA
jgi:hypothetical protein